MKKKEYGKNFPSKTEFTVREKDGIIIEIGNSYTYHPKPNFKGEKMKWFDDTIVTKRRIMTSKENAILALVVERYQLHSTYQTDDPCIKQIAQMLCDKDLEEMWILTQE